MGVNGLRRPRRRGNNAIEFALILPVLMMILTGIADYGWYFSQNQGVVMAAREGARAGAISPRLDAEDNGQAKAEAMMRQLGIAEANFTVTPDSDIYDANGNQLLQISIVATNTALTGYLPKPDYHRATVTMRLEDQVP